MYHRDDLLAKRSGATVIGIASAANAEWLIAKGITPVEYGANLADRLREAHLNAFIDTHGSDYVKLAIELGVAPERIDTIIDFKAAKQYGAKSDGSQSAMNASVLAELAELLARGELEISVAATFPLSEVQAAFRELEQGHTHGKIVLLP